MGRNQEVAQHLRTIAQLLSLDGAGKFRVDAYENAARAVETLGGPVEEADLSRIPGVGKSTATTVQQFLATGVSMRMQDLAQRWPVRALTMTRVKGIGVKTAMKLHMDGIADFDALAAMAEAGALMKKGERDDALIREVLYAKDLGEGRKPFDVAFALGNWAAAEVSKLAGVSSVTVCGSVRRGAATSKDVDLIVLLEPGANRDVIAGGFLALGDPINSGQAKASAYLTHQYQTMQADIWMVEEWHHGAALVYATGSKAHCIALRARAQTLGLTLNEYGLFPAGCPDFSDTTSLAGRTEAGVYDALGLPWIEPQDRTGDLP